MSGFPALFSILICLMISNVEIDSQNEIVAVEAEHFISQESDNIRKWHIISADETDNILGAQITSHASTASGKSYLKILPDTRITHDDSLIAGINFSNQPGKLGVLNYRIQVKETGRYYVWVRAYSTGAEDNGIHVGLDGEWPESGQRMQWCEGKNQWTWESKQRTKEVHCGEPHLIYLDIDTPGEHMISFSMREDGFEFDKWIISKEYVKPKGEGVPETAFNE